MKSSENGTDLMNLYRELLFGASQTMLEGLAVSGRCLRLVCDRVE